MSRYIDADRLLSESTLSRTASNWDTCITVDDIDACPTEDVAPVKHAHWVGTEADGYADGSLAYDVWECSECGYEHDGEEDTLTPYCPMCGAKMDEEESQTESEKEKP